MKVLVTGGAGYIGTHTLVELISAGHEVVVYDNFRNSSPKAIARVEELVGQKVPVVRGDIRDRACLDRTFAEHSVEAVIHFAGLKAVGESYRQPLSYYDNNVTGTQRLLEAMEEAGVRSIVFSSSATVYGEDAPVPYAEAMGRGRPSNPYGATKAVVEQMIEDLARADSRWSASLLRYFNPIGAHPSGRIGEDPQGIPNNLLPFISQVAVGRLPELSIFGDDYPTRDGTCERDYLHVVDLAVGHVKALEAMKKTTSSGVATYNLGTGRGTTVLEMVRSFEQVTGQGVPYRIASRREGDLPAFWADASKARSELGWSAEKTLEDMMRDSWRWQSANPEGYSGA
ncbi:MAG: UDP-glucose 4-epimerase GalE [Gammaproteobacteria bacterium]|nr:UDP-glucose 4-epimerase GalE [Gammaproteobacteria bacterium]